jgi:multidrug efflux pump
MSNGYQRWVARPGAQRPLPADVCRAGGGAGLWLQPAAQAFLPTEDQGYTITDIQLPPGASRTHRTGGAQIEAHNAEEPGVGNTTLILGFSFSGSGQNAALAFTTLKDWSERGDDSASPSPTARPWPSPSSRTPSPTRCCRRPSTAWESSGFEFRLQDRGGMGHAN